MKKILGLFIVAAFVGLSVLAFTPTPSYALPNFAKKFNASCTLCHTVWPALNRFGEQFFMNGFQMPDTEDGGDVSKIKPAETLSLDSGNANPPLSVRMVIETTLTRDTAVEGAGTDSRASLIVPTKAEVPFFLGGTLGKNLSYFVDNAGATEPGEGVYVAESSGGAVTKKVTLGGVEQMWGGIHNLGGPGTANIRYGLINTADFDAWSNHRHDLGGSFADSVASDTHTDAVGLQVYGRPGFGPITYQVSADTHGRNKSNNLDFGLMLRGDFGPAAVSYHYAGSSTRDTFASTGYTETTTSSNLLAARAIMPSFEVSLAYALMSSEAKPQGGTSSKSEVNGLVLEGIYFTDIFDIQARYSSGTASKIANVTSGLSNYDRSRISLKLDYFAMTNGKLFFKYETDSYKGDALKTGGVYNTATGGYNDGYASIGVDWAL